VIPLILAACALVFALVDEAQARGRSLTGWAVAFLAIALLWGHVG
jgi:hypothetical protein